MEEFLRVLLIEALKTGMGILAKAGFEDKVRELRDRLTGGNEKKLEKAFAQAYQAAAEASGDEPLKPLLKHEPFYRSVVTGLLDPVAGFDLGAAADVWGERLPEQARALRGSSTCWKACCSRMRPGAPCWNATAPCAGRKR